MSVRNLSVLAVTAALVAHTAGSAAADEPVAANSSPPAIEAALVVDKAIELALDKLSEGNVRGFTVGYLAAVKSYAELAECLHAHAYACGSAAAELKWALAEVQRLDTQPAERGAPVAGRMSEVRGQMLTDLQALREQYRAAPTEERGPLAEAIQLQVDWLDTLDQWLGGWSGNQQVDVSLPLAQLTHRVQLIQRQLARDEQLQELAALTLTEVFAQSQADLERALDVMLVKQSLPGHTLAELRQSMAPLRDVLKQAQAARVSALQAARHELNAGETPVKLDELEARVEALLGNDESPARTSATRPPARRPCPPVVASIPERSQP